MALLESDNGSGFNLDSIKDAVKRTMNPLDEARHLPGDIYTSAEVLALEKQRVFMKDWLCMARVEEIENPGDYMTFRVLGEPVLIARDEDGEVNAFANVCRHRGVEVATGAGNAKEFSCPYHGWLYDLKGNLQGVPFMKNVRDFDFKNCRLKTLGSAIWAGFIFVNFDADAEPFEDYVKDFDDAFGMLKMEECRLADKLVADLDCNWKLVVENFMDIYHVQTIHTDTFSGAIKLEDFNFKTKERGFFSAFYDAAPMVIGQKTLFGKMPWMEKYPESFACTGILAPNLQMFARIDDVQPFVIWPLAPDKTRVIVYTLMPTKNFADPAFDEKMKSYVDFMTQVVGEDEGMVRSLQNGVGSRSFEPGPLSYLETSIHHLINYNLERTFGKDGGA